MSDELTFIAQSINSTIQLIKNGEPLQINLLYSLDNKKTWVQYNIGDIIQFPKKGSKISFLNKTNNFSKNVDNFYYFKMTGLIKATGNINSLINYSDLSTYCFIYLFNNCISLTTIPQLPSTKLALGCYYSMFSGCTGITKLSANLLPATKLQKQCYKQMFNGCSGIKSIPAKLLQSTYLAISCYSAMFIHCTGIKSIPAKFLPATTLQWDCYKTMFAGCTSLKSIPASLLPATELTDNCYQEMFRNCPVLTTLPATLLKAIKLAPSCYHRMFMDCTGLTKIPDKFLPATELVSTCYLYMFWGCKNLNYIRANFTDWGKNANNINPTSCWLTEVSKTGTFVKKADLPQIRGKDYIPQGWTIKIIK